MINPFTYENYGQPLTEAAENAVLKVGHLLSKVHRKLITDPEDVIAIRQAFEREVLKEAQKWTNQWKHWVDNELADAYLAGIYHTEAELKALKEAGYNLRDATEEIAATQELGGSSGKQPPSIPTRTGGKFTKYPDHLTFYGVFRQAAYDRLEGTDVRIMRAAEDEFRKAATEAASSRFRESDKFTRRKFSQDLLNNFSQRGLQTITYRNGRTVSLDAYAETVGRTQSGHAAIQASMNRYREYGYDLVRVSSHFVTCKLCAPYEGKILSTSGKSIQYQSLSDAIAGGLFHPNCEHDVNAYIPGVSPEQMARLDPYLKDLVEKEGYAKVQEMAYEAQKQQRAIERHIRDWKRREATAIESTAKAQAHVKVLEWQAVQRKHIKENPFLRRKYEREQIKRAH